MEQGNNPVATKAVQVILTATTSVEYREVIQVPADFSDEELNKLVNQRYDAVCASQYLPVVDMWDRGDCSTDAAMPGATPDAQVVRVDGGFNVIELAPYPEITYITNSGGEPTEHGPVSERQINQIEAGVGPGDLLVYLVDIDNRRCVLGNLEVAYQAPAWQDPALAPEDAVRANCIAVVERIRANASEHPDEFSLVFPVDHDDMPDRCVISVSVPLHFHDTPETVRQRLSAAFMGFEDIDKVYNLAN